jgi:peptidyl-tRNA hydrolase
MWKQIVIVRRDLHMLTGKVASQVTHGSMAFLTTMIRDNTFKVNDGYHCVWIYNRDGTGNRRSCLYKRSDLNKWAEQARNNGQDGFYCELVDPLKENKQKSTRSSA